MGNKILPTTAPIHNRGCLRQWRASSMHPGSARVAARSRGPSSTGSTVHRAFASDLSRNLGRWLVTVVLEREVESPNYQFSGANLLVSRMVSNICELLDLERRDLRRRSPATSHCTFSCLTTRSLLACAKAQDVSNSCCQTLCFHGRFAKMV